MPNPREIAEQNSRPGFFGREAEDFVREQEQASPRDRAQAADPVNPPVEAAPCKNLKGG